MTKQKNKPREGLKTISKGFKLLLGIDSKVEKRMKKEKELMEKKFNSLSISDKNAYEQIMERHESPSMLGLFYEWFRVIAEVAIFLIILSFMTGVSLDSLRPVYFMLLKVTPMVFIAFFIVMIIFWFVDLVNRIKLRRELLLKK